MKKLLSFDFWQKLGKALLVVVAVMPAAGIMISLGKVVAMLAGDVHVCHLAIYPGRD
ncbi:UNVERIFIED_CONTAM: phosphotransferase system glucose/maltose/N-acetylglucosamine-specific IIC component [Paenibacillus sp. PvR008]